MKNNSPSPIELVQAIEENVKNVYSNNAERNVQIKIKVTEEEKDKIMQNANVAGYSSVAAYVRSQCLNTNNTLPVWKKCEIREELQEIVKLSGNDSKVIRHTDKICHIIDKVGE